MILYLTLVFKDLYLDVFHNCTQFKFQFLEVPVKSYYIHHQDQTGQGEKYSILDIWFIYIKKY